MLEWYLRLIGVSDEFTGHLNDARLVFPWWGGVPLDWGLYVLVGALVTLIPIGVGIYILQRVNLGTAPRSLTLALTFTRVTVLALLVLIVSNITLRIDHASEKKPIVALLFDHSQSMQLPAGPFESDAELLKIAQAAGYRVADGKLDVEARKALNRVGRAKLAHSAVQASAKAFLEPLNKKYEVQFVGFSRESAPLAVAAGQTELPEPPNPGGAASHIGDAVGRVLEEAGGRPVAGVIVFTDGQNTGGRSLSEAAAAAGAAGAPVFSVPVGSATRLRDVSIVDVFTSGLVSVGDNARVAVTLESTGFDKRPVKIELRDGDKLLDSKDLILNGAEQQQIELGFQAKEPGARYLTVTVPPLAEEPEYLRDNNTDTAYVRVSEEKIRVLYVEGLPRWDYRFLKNAMRRDHGLGGRAGNEPDLVLEAEYRRWPAERQQKALPRKLEHLAEYHTVILGDVSPQMLGKPFLDQLTQAVREKGVGLIVQTGPQAMPQTYDDRFLELLPIRFRPNTAGMEAPVYKPFRIELTPEGAVHEAMRFYDDPGRNQVVWSHMPPLYWCAAAERASPAASVLAANPNIQNRWGKQPLIAHHFAGQGRVMFVGTDSTWLWRQNVGDRFFYKFWGQSIRFVARRDQAGSKLSRVEVRPVRAQPGEQATIELMAFDKDGAPRTEPTLAMQVAGPGGLESVEVSADPAVKGRYVGRFPLKTIGEYKVTYQPGGDLKPVDARVRVAVAPEELRHPNVNRLALEQMAKSSAGGALVELPDLASIVDKLKGESSKTELHREATLWDNWLTLLALIFVYSLDVGLRRLAGLS